MGSSLNQSQKKLALNWKRLVWWSVLCQLGKAETTFPRMVIPMLYIIQSYIGQKWNLHRFGRWKWNSSHYSLNIVILECGVRQMQVPERSTLLSPSSTQGQAFLPGHSLCCLRDPRSINKHGCGSKQAIVALSISSPLVLLWWLDVLGFQIYVFSDPPVTLHFTFPTFPQLYKGLIPIINLLSIAQKDRLPGWTLDVAIG